MAILISDLRLQGHRLPVRRLLAAKGPAVVVQKSGTCSMLALDGLFHGLKFSGRFTPVSIGAGYFYSLDLFEFWSR